MSAGGTGTVRWGRPRCRPYLDGFTGAGTGVPITIAFVRRVLDDAAFRKGRHTTGLVDRLPGVDDPAGRAADPVSTGGTDDAHP